MNVEIKLSFGEIALLLDALQRGASRHETMARFRPGVARAHDEMAAEMRKLHLRLIKARHDAKVAARIA